MLRRLGSIPIVWATLALAACSEGEANGVHGEDTIVDAPVCYESRTAIGDLDEVVAELGFYAADVLAFSAKEHESVLRWLPTQSLTYGPESGDVTLSATVEYTGGPIEFVQSTRGQLVDAEPVAGVEVVPFGMGCFDALAIEVEVEITTAGGALAERFTTEMRASSTQTANISKGAGARRSGWNV